MIYAMMVTRNEAGRYLEAVIENLHRYVDEVFAYDDDSIDDTVKILRGMKCVNCPRDRTQPTFMQHEGRFRTNALRSLEGIIQPHDNEDWIFVADADEFFVANPETLRELISGLQPHHQAVRLRIHSVWQQEENGELLHRWDGPWQTLYEPRLWRWHPGMAFADVPMACRNEPVMVTMNPGAIAVPQTGSAILHYGYANQRDRIRRYNRYTSLQDHGHSPTFIESILETQPSLIPWRGRVPADVLP